MQNSDILYQNLTAKNPCSKTELWEHMLQRYQFTEEDYRGEDLKNWESPLKGK